MKNNIVIRLEEKNEYRKVENLVRDSFWNVYRPGCLEHYALEKAAELGCGALCFEGNIYFYGKSGFKQANEYGIRYHGLPEGEDASFFLCKELIPAELGCGALCFEGNIYFYGKSGFKQANEYGIRYHGLPEGEDASFFLCKELIPGYFDGITGEYATPEGYLVDEQEAEEFDKQFPYKAKKKLPRQIF